MDQLKCEIVERDPGMCVCKGGPTLSILKDVQKAYEDRMELIEKSGGSKKLQMQVNLLKSWVGDLVGQNTLLARAVEELETEATTTLLTDRRKNKERGGNKNISGNMSELKLLNDTLHKENIAKDREIMRLNKDMQQYEQAIMNLRSEMSLSSCYQTQNVSKKDAEVMAGMCSIGSDVAQTDWEPVKDGSVVLHDETHKYRERIDKMETNLKGAGTGVRALRAANAALSDEALALRRVCAALDHQARAAALRAQFKDDIIREMRRQLKQAKAKLKEVSEPLSLTSKDFVSGDHDFGRTQSAPYVDSVTIACVRQQPRRKRHAPPAAVSPLSPPSPASPTPPSPSLSDDCRSARLHASEDEILSAKPE